jgi:heme exporter protein D
MKDRFTNFLVWAAIGISAVSIILTAFHAMHVENKIENIHIIIENHETK